jgi:heat-inducible transcriptional repressor
MKQVDKLLNERAESLLKALIEQYIAEGQPVGSKTLANTSNVDLSPASIRNVLSELEKMGFVASPHTSAGRVPTPQGYRYFVDSLITTKPLSPQTIDQMVQDMMRTQQTNELVTHASQFLSQLTSFAGIVTFPRRTRLQLKHIEFLPLSEERLLAILVTSDNEVQNRIIPVARTYTKSELQRAANYLNEKFAGQPIESLRQEIMDEMHQVREDMDKAMREAVELAGQALNDDLGANDENFVVAGQTNLLTAGSWDNIQQLRQLFDAFNEKQDILSLLDQSLSASGVQIFIGEESGYEVLGECSIITASYSSEGEVIGSLGVIGPTRMPYEQVISVVDITAKVLSSALNSR